MKQLKRLNLKKSTTLNVAEMKEILGGATVVGVTCDPQASNCSGPCGSLMGSHGTCRNLETVYNLCACVED